MTTKVILRCLTAEGSMLGWVQVNAVIRGDGQLWSPGPVVVTPFASGVCAVLSFHWCDVNVEVRQHAQTVLTAGVSSVIYPESSPIITVGPVPEHLPTLTVGSVVVQPLVGAVGMRGN